MKILMPFPYLEIFDRYVAQMKAIAERIDRFHIAYCSGQPREEWKKHFVFHKLMHHPYDPKRVGWMRRSLWAPCDLLRVLFSKRAIFSSVGKVEVDLYYVLGSFWQQELASHLADKNDKPYVVRVRGNIQAELQIKQHFPFKVFYSYSLRRNLKNAALIIPITQQAKKTTIYWGVPEEKFSEPIGLGVDTNQFYPIHNEQTETLTVGYAGRLSEEKGIYRLLKLAKQLPSKIKFYLAGRKQAHLEYPKNVEYLGRIPHNEMVKFYNKCDLIALPSFTEGFPNVVIEAYACGKQILATPEAFPKELKCFGSVAPFNEWHSTLLSLKDSETNAPEARKYVKENYTWKKFGESIVKCLEEVE